MKYEPVFGDQSLFDGAPSDSTHATKGGGFYMATEDGGVQYLSRGPLNGDRCKYIDGYLIAERRIIAEPKRWTVADQKAGRLPEVGSVFTHRNETLTCLFIDADGEIWAHDINNRIVTPSLRNCYPLETPEEKAARLKECWGARAAELFARADDGAAFDFIYDAILSGELPVPVKGE